MWARSAHADIWYGYGGAKRPRPEEGMVWQGGVWARSALLHKGYGYGRGGVWARSALLHEGCGYGSGGPSGPKVQMLSKIWSACGAKEVHFGPSGPIVPMVFKIWSACGA